MQKKSSVKVTKEREVKTYTHMWHTSDVLLTQGLSNEAGSFHQFMASLVFSAFTLEASLNHIGRKIFTSWNELEQLNPKSKLLVIAEKLNIKIDFGMYPWQIMNDLFRFRNDIAHGKSSDIAENKEIKLDSFNQEKFGELLKTRWEEYCTKQNAINARKHVQEIIETIYKACGFDDDFAFSAGIQHGSAEIK